MRIEPLLSRTAFSLFVAIPLLSGVLVLLSSVVPIVEPARPGAKEAILRAELNAFRIALDKYYRLEGRWPKRLDELVSANLLRDVPDDPFTRSRETWILVKSSNPDGTIGVSSVHSGSPAVALDGEPLSSW